MYHTHGPWVMQQPSNFEGSCTLLGGLCYDQSDLQEIGHDVYQHGVCVVDCIVTPSFNAQCNRWLHQTMEPIRPHKVPKVHIDEIHISSIHRYHTKTSVIGLLQEGSYDESASASFLVNG